MSDKNLNPIIQFKEWFNLAISNEINDPNAMCLSTISSDNKPHSRMVLLKDYNDEGFVFYTNYESNKGNDISINSNVCLNFHWKSLLRQVRIEGTIEKLSEEISDKYYNSAIMLSFKLASYVIPFFIVYSVFLVVFVGLRKFVLK